jgi:hypothetical protein
MLLIGKIVLPRIDRLSRSELEAFVLENLSALGEEEVLAVIRNAHVTPQLLGKIAQTPRLAGFHSVRVKLVAHRQTPQAHAVKLVHYLYWVDLLSLSVEVQVAAPVRRAIDTQLLIRVEKLSLGEKVTSARRCSQALVKVFLYDPHPRVFESLLVNKRLREDDLLALMASHRATPEQLLLIAGDMKWSYRYAIRKALVMNPATPRAAAASQLKYLSGRDLRSIHDNPSTSVYVKRCIERIQPRLFSAGTEVIDYNTGPDA